MLLTIRQTRQLFASMLKDGAGHLENQMAESASSYHPPFFAGSLRLRLTGNGRGRCIDGESYDGEQEAPKLIGDLDAEVATCR